MPNNSHVDVFIYSMRPFRTWKSKNVRMIGPIEQAINSNGNNMNLSVLVKFYTD